MSSCETLYLPGSVDRNSQKRAVQLFHILNVLASCFARIFNSSSPGSTVENFSKVNSPPNFLSKLSMDLTFDNFKQCAKHS